MPSDEEKMPDNKIFSKQFPVFFLKQVLSPHLYLICQLNLLPGLPILKAVADDKSEVTQNIKVVFHRIENIVEKEENAG